MTMSDIAATFCLLRLRPALSSLTRTEFPGCHLGISNFLVLIYLVMPFGWNGDPPNFAHFGDAAWCTRAKFGMSRPDWHLSVPCHSKLYVDDGRLIDIRNAIRQQGNAPTWELITMGILGLTNPPSRNWRGKDGGGRHTMLGFDIYPASLQISSQDAKITGPRGLFFAYPRTTAPMRWDFTYSNIPLAHCALLLIERTLEIPHMANRASAPIH